MSIGFGSNGNGRAEPFYHEHIGQPGHYGAGHVSATGVLREVNIEAGYIVVQPSIVGFGEEARLVYDRPTTVTLPQGNPLFFRPLKKGDLQRIVDKNNDDASASNERKKNKSKKKKK